VIRTFADRGTKAIFEGGHADPKDAKRARKRLPTQLWEKARAKLDEIDAAEDPTHLDLPSNRLEKLSGDPEGQYATWINRQYRICLTWRDGDAHDLEIVDYHD
jgi:proteic killer suppression protein